METITETFNFFGHLSTVAFKVRVERGITDEELLDLEMLIAEGEIE